MTENVAVQYTLWSLGRLLGYTDLGFIARENGYRTGWFYPDESAQEILDVATGISPALFAAANATNQVEAYVEAEKAVERCEALKLEVRGPDGRVIPTESISLRDTVWLMSLDTTVTDAETEQWYAALTEEERAGFDAAVEEQLAEWNDPADEWKRGGADDEDEDEESDLPRYQLQLRLVDHSAIP